MAIIGVLTTILSGNNAPLLASLAQSEAAMKGYASGTVTGSQVAQKALLGIGIGAAVGTLLAVKAAADFEDAMTGVRKTVDEADLTAAGLTFEGLGLAFRQMALELPVAATELAAIGETAGALGIRAADIENFTRVVAMLGVTTDLSTSGAAEALGKIGTILNFTGSDYANFADILVNLGNKGASTESEIIEITKRFAAAGQLAGLSTAEILAFSSAIASAGVEPEAAGSALSRMFQNMVLGAAKGTTAGKAFAKTTGMEFGKFSKLVETDTVGAMLLVLESLSKLESGPQLLALDAMGIKGVNLTKAVQLLAATYETNLIPAIENANNAQGAAAAETAKKLEALLPQLALLGNAVTELGISLGTALLPPLTTFVQQISGAVSGVSAWAAANPNLSSTLLPLAAGIAGVGLALAVLGGPITIVGGAIALLILNMENLERGARRVLDLLAQILAPPGGVEPPAGASTSFGQVAPPMPAYAGSPGYNSFSFGDPRPAAPWGTFNTPGFAAGEAGSPFAGPRTPVQITITSTPVVLDGEKVGTIVERRLYNDWSGWNSGGSSPGPTPIR